MMVFDALNAGVCNSALAQNPSIKQMLFSLFGACQPSVVTGLDVAVAPGDHVSCPSTSPWSCSTSQTSSCCYEGSNGVFLQTQFWDYNPATGPDESWTLHGLWSDKCSGGYQQFCNSGWEIQSAEETLEGLGMNSLVDTMSEYWKNQGSTDDSLWTHEFNKHGTCMSTVSPDCYDSSQPANQNVGDFFSRAVSLYQTLDTYDWLSNAGITPSYDQTWTVSEFSDALVSHTDGHTVYLGCDQNNAVNEVWYFFSLKGSVADGEFKFIDSVSTSSCTDGFSYLPKEESGGGDEDSTQKQKGTISVVPSGGSSNGCLISDGSWFTSGTCASFTIAKTAGGVSLTSSKGPCGIYDGSFRCSQTITPSDFELKGNSLSYGGSTFWSASSTPGSDQRAAVSPNGNGSVKVELTSSVTF